MEPDFENMAINEYLEYEAKMEWRLRMNVQSKRCPTKYEEVDFDSFHWNESNTFNYLYSHGLPPPHPCFPPVRPYPEDCLVSTNDVDNLEKEEAQVEDGDDDDDIYEITIKDVERIRQFLAPNVPDDEIFEEFKDEILNVTIVDEEANFNLAKDKEELEILIAEDPQSHFYRDTNSISHH
nr:hypothetical protein [Tanacetum cinerariifolium]